MTSASKTSSSALDERRCEVATDERIFARRFQNFADHRVTVLLPLVPVMPTIGALTKLQASSNSPITGSCAWPRPRAVENRARMPGVVTTRSTPSSHAGFSAPSCNSSGGKPRAIDIGLAFSQDQRRAPWAARNSRPRRPVDASPTTITVCPRVHHRFSIARRPLDSAKFQRPEREQRAHDRNDPEANHHHGFGPSA